jgi:hypothetical protein
MEYDKDKIIDTAMQIIKDEHEFFVSESIDNSEHIPRIVRIASSAGKVLSTNGVGKQEVERTIDRIIQYGQQLFIDEWMALPLDDDDPPCEEDAIDEFNQYAKNTKVKYR